MRAYQRTVQKQFQGSHDTFSKSLGQYRAQFPCFQTTTGLSLQNIPEKIVEERRSWFHSSKIHDGSYCSEN